METFTNQPIIETVKSIKIGFDKSVYLKWKGLVYSQYKWMFSAVICYTFFMTQDILYDLREKIRIWK